MAICHHRAKRHRFRDDAHHQCGRAEPTLLFLPWPNSLPVFRLRKCSLVQAGQMIASYSFSRTSRSSSDQCWTFIDVVGQVKITAAIVEI
jgi:hypothetical protein